MSINQIAPSNALHNKHRHHPPASSPLDWWHVTGAYQRNNIKWSFNRCIFNRSPKLPIFCTQKHIHILLIEYTLRGFEHIKNQIEFHKYLISQIYLDDMAALAQASINIWVVTLDTGGNFKMTTNEPERDHHHIFRAQCTISYSSFASSKFARIFWAGIKMNIWDTFEFCVASSSIINCEIDISRWK